MLTRLEADDWGDTYEDDQYYYQDQDSWQEHDPWQEHEQQEHDQQEHEHTEQGHQLHYQTSTEGGLGYEERMDEQEHAQEGKTLFESEDENQDE
jgi:hypothetical protein